MSRQLLAVEATYPDPAPPADRLTVQGLRGGAAVLMVAAFENYLREMLLEVMADLTADPPRKRMSLLPEKMRVSSVFLSLNDAMRGPRFDKPGGRQARLLDIQRAARLVHNDLIDAVALSNTGGNPAPETVAELLKNIGITDPFTAVRPEFDRRWGRAEAVGFVRDKLEEIVLRRHKVAHAADVLALSRADLLAGVEFLQTVSEAIDVVVGGHVAAL